MGELTKEGGPGQPAGRDDASKTATQGRAVRRTTTEELLQGGNEMIIAHRGEEYRLRITSNGKLILNK